MKRKYEGVIVLNLQGKEESVDDLVNKISKALEKEGAKMDQIDKIGRKEFAYQSRKTKQDHGYYVNYRFEAEPSVIDKVRTKLALNDDIQLQHYQTL